MPATPKKSPELKTFIAVHKHEYGGTYALFKSSLDMEKIFNALPQTEFGDDEAEGTLTRVDFAYRLNLDYEPDREEELNVERIDVSKINEVDFSDFV